MDFPIQTMQPMYYVAESFKSAGEMLIRYGEFLPKPFKAYYNHATNKVEVDRALTSLLKYYKKDYKRELYCSFLEFYTCGSVFSSTHPSAIYYNNPIVY